MISSLPATAGSSLVASALVADGYVVVTGMDWQREAVFLNDPARGKLLRVERGEFEREWQAGGNWMLLAVPASAN